MQGEKVYLRTLTFDDLEELVELEVRNRELFEQFSATRRPDFYSIEGQALRLQMQEANWQSDSQYNFGIFLNGIDTLIGSINLVQVVRGPLQRAIMGYTIDQDHSGRGYATEAVKLLVDYGFRELQLHRIEAGVMPHHGASIRVLEAGFHKEGIAIKNVRINGVWQDHQILAIINPED